VGARCAGAALASYLARGGASVLLLEQSSLPSDVVLSTHTLHPSGMAVMHELGLGGAVREVSPEMGAIRFDWHGAVLDLPLPAGDGEFCPRRQRFDALLQEAAAAAGATLRDRTRVTSLERTNDRVTGVRFVSSAGNEGRASARLVVGADGRHSAVARWVAAEEYLGYEAPRGMYWSYWPAPRGWGRSADYPGGMYIARIGNAVRVAFHTDGDQLLVGAVPLKRELAPFRSDPLGALQSALARDALLAPLTRAEPCERVRGYLGERYFFRQGCGPGWLLLGDAGVHKDFLSGDGMSEALLQAQRAAATILASRDDAALQRGLTRWWRERDVDALTLFFHARDLAQPDVSPALDRLVLQRVARDPQLCEAFRGIFRRTQSPYTLLPIGRALAWIMGAALRGQPGLLREFVARGRRNRQVLDEIERRRRLLWSLDRATPATDERRVSPRRSASHS
jgi:flavin-dependent dehydrogenase